jgi:hypothetical protein
MDAPEDRSKALNICPSGYSIIGEVLGERLPR